ncbi:MAG: M14 family metallocarboxypeptidase [Burkholderiaceae bacterium]|nr:M14 family metallocarboxypeptidase [Burkholderiaceae bacterium]
MNAIDRWAWARLWLLGAVLAGCAAAPVAREEPPLPYSAAVAARFAAPRVSHDTPGLRAGREQFTTNEELQAWQRELLRRGGRDGTRIEGVDVGRSQRNEPLQALRFTRGDGRPAVLLIGQQHGDEPAGAEALMVVAEQLAGERLPGVLDRIDVVLLVRANPDGAAWGTRVAADGHDINRDHLLLRTPEAQALAALARRFNPVVVVDVHEHTVVGRYLEKFNAVQRNDLLLQYATTANYPAALREASERWFMQPLQQALAREGLTHEWYYTNPTTPGDLRLNMGGMQPDTGRNVHGLKQAVSLLLESRGVGIGRLHLQRRVHSHVVAVRSVLESAAANAPALVELQRSAGAEVGARACRGDVTVLAAATPMQRNVLMLDPQTGADKPVQVQWGSSLHPRVLRSRARPCGYWMAVDQLDAANKLRELGVRVWRLSADTQLQAEPWLERSRSESARPDVRGTIADAAPTMIAVQVDLAPTQPLDAPAGSWYVPLDQPLAHLVVAALEPDTPNSYFANRIVPALEAVMRVRTPPAVALSRP